MASTQTLLQEVNEVLKRAKIIQDTSGELTTLTDSSIQSSIDLCVSAWNDTLDELMRTDVFRGETSEATLTLATDTREYSFESDFVKFANLPATMIDQTNGNTLTPYPGGFDQMRLDQLTPANFTGLPRRYTVNPSSDKIRVDASPNSAENGRAYVYDYEKTTNIILAASTFPINNEAVFALRSAVSQWFDMLRKGEMKEGVYQMSMARAAHQINPKPRAKRYNRIKRVPATGWPF